VTTYCADLQSWTDNYPAKSHSSSVSFADADQKAFNHWKNYYQQLHCPIGGGGGGGTGSVGNDEQKASAQAFVPKAGCAVYLTVTMLENSIYRQDKYTANLDAKAMVQQYATEQANLLASLRQCGSFELTYPAE